jgi:hypothetical protein
LRLRLIGPTRHYDALRRQIDDRNWKGVTRSAGETFVFIDKVLDGLDLDLDLEEVARGDDPPALLARELLTLGQSGEKRSALLEAARLELRGLASESRWSVLNEERDPQDPRSDDALAALLTKSGTNALNQLLSQRDSDAETGP